MMMKWRTNTLKQVNKYSNQVLEKWELHERLLTNKFGNLKNWNVL